MPRPFSRIVALDDVPIARGLFVGDRRFETNVGWRWNIEAAELSGIKRAEVEHVKALRSRDTDRARLSYDRLVTEVRRQCIIVGTTNSTEYLHDSSGNRRFGRFV